MLFLILLLIIGGIMVYLAQNNLMLVPLHIGSYELTGIPLFYVIIGSLLVGLGLGYLLQFVHSIVNAISMHGKDSKIKQGNSDIVDLTKRIHELELENEKLKNTSPLRAPRDNNAL